ncbi:hypothetical protein LCGC14_3159570, partial [marine sediment metagenome]
MSYYRVISPFKIKTVRGNILDLTPGQAVDIPTKALEEQLMAQGKITLMELPTQGGRISSQPANRYARTKRVGIWLVTSAGYSGGRIHMYQYAWCLADAGAEVYLITNGHPKWAKDYPASPRINVLIAGKDNPPADLDL